MDSSEKKTLRSVSPAAQTRHTQARGRERRRHLLRAARELLDEKDIGEISLQDISQRAGIPISSTYHFYENKNAVFAALAADFGSELIDVLGSPYAADDIDSWEDIIDAVIDRAVEWYGENRSARQLLIGGKAAPEIKLSDRVNDQKLGEIIEDAIAEHFVLPDLPQRSLKLFYFVEIADLMLSLSEIYHGEITAEMVAEAKVAGKGYLSAFLPKYLTRRSNVPDAET